MTEWELVNLSDSKPQTIVEDLSNTDAGGLQTRLKICTQIFGKKQTT